MLETLPAFPLHALMVWQLSEAATLLYYVQ